LKPYELSARSTASASALVSRTGYRGSPAAPATPLGLRLTPLSTVHPFFPLSEPDDARCLTPTSSEPAPLFSMTECHRHRCCHLLPLSSYRVLMHGRNGDAVGQRHPLRLPTLSLSCGPSQKMLVSVGPTCHTHSTHTCPGTVRKMLGTPPHLYTKAYKSIS
jgi:hypothetical protein